MEYTKFTMNRPLFKEIMNSFPTDTDKNLIVLYGQITGSSYSDESYERYKKSSFYDF